MNARGIATHEEAFLVDRLAAFALDGPTSDPNVMHEGRRIILDQIACQIAAAPLPWSVQYLQAAKTFGSGEGATVLYYGDRLRVDQAAFVNGAFGQGAEFDDTHLKSSTHAGAVIVPTVFALGEIRGISGKAALDAVIIGVEILLRIATAAAPHLHERGHHVPPAVGPFAAAAAAARILGLDARTTAHAIAIGGSHSSGLLEFTQAGGSVKRGHCGIAAMAGMRSAFLAAAGITGPAAILEGRRGFFETFAGEYDASLLTAGLGERFEILEIGYKPMTSAFPAHAPLEALGMLIAAHKIEADQIASIRIGMSNHSLNHVGVIREPRDITDAHYSVAFGAAVRLLRGGNGFYDYREEDLHDPRFLEIVRKVSVYVDPVAEEERHRLKNRGAVVGVRLVDGREVEQRVQFSKGHPKNPLTDDDLMRKFMDTVSPRLGEPTASRICEQVMMVETMPSISELLRLTLKGT
jgi:2-methylcitrate dehydratase PrpD